MHRSSDHPARKWLAPLLGVMAFAAFPAAASAATPATSCTVAAPAVASNPCYTAPPMMVPPPPPTPQDEVTSPQVGRTIIANKGTWTGASTYKYQWLDCTDATETTCTNASPPSINTTYKIAQGDVGQFLALQITATGAGGATYANSAPSGNAVKNGTPLNRLAPTLSGATLDGQLLTLTSGTWDGTMPISYGYQLRRCDGAGLKCSKAFTGAPGPASDGLSAGYILQDADLGHIIVGYTTATNVAGSTSVHSPTTTTVVTPANTAVPTIPGTAQAGQKLTESHGSWIPTSPTGYTYQWQDCDASGGNCASVAGATSQSYTPSSGDVGHTLRVLESATGGGVTSSPATSAATGVVKAATTSGGGSNGGSSGGSNGGSNGGSSGSPAKFNAGKIRALLHNALAVHGKAGTIRGVLKYAGYSFKFAAPAAGRLVVTWYFVPKHGKKTVVATVTVVFHGTARATAKIQLTGAGRRLLSGTRRMALSATGSFRAAGHQAVSSSRKFTLKA